MLSPEVIVKRLQRFLTVPDDVHQLGWHGSIQPSIPDFHELEEGGKVTPRLSFREPEVVAKDREHALIIRENFFDELLVVVLYEPSELIALHPRIIPSYS